MEHFDFNFHLQSRVSLFHVFVFFECVAAPRRLVVIAGVRQPPGGSLRGDTEQTRQSAWRGGALRICIG